VGRWVDGSIGWRGVGGFAVRSGAIGRRWSRLGLSRLAAGYSMIWGLDLGADSVVRHA